MLLTALAVMMCATLAQHLGLSEAAAGVAARIARCPKCMSFWCTALALLALGCDPLATAGLSLLMAYASHWFGLALCALNILFDRTWQKTNNPGRKDGRTRRRK